MEKYYTDLLNVLERIAIALESIDLKLGKDSSSEELELVQGVRPENTKVESVRDEFEEIEDALKHFRCHNNVRNTIVKRLYHSQKTVNMTFAVNMSRFYEGVNNDKIKTAIKNGEIKSVVPEMKTVPVTFGCVNTKDVEKPVGSYAVDSKSLISWLEHNGECNLADTNPIRMAMKKMLNQ